MSGNSSKLLAVNYTGSKFQACTDIYPYIWDQHEHFVDVFCGSLAMLLNKKPSRIETASDINGRVINFFRVLRDKRQEFLNAVTLSPYSRREFESAWDDEGCSDVELARRFYVRCRQGIYGYGAQKQSKGWELARKKTAGGRAATVNAWCNGIEGLADIALRLLDIQLENRCFRQLIPAIDYAGAFFYCDPPYPKECRVSNNDYEFEFTDDDHRDLARILHKIKGKAMISSYDCKLMRKLYRNWHMIKLPAKRNSARSTAVQECIWMNYDPYRLYNQMTLEFTESTL